MNPFETGKVARQAVTAVSITGRLAERRVLLSKLQQGVDHLVVARILARLRATTCWPLFVLVLVLVAIRF